VPFCAIEAALKMGMDNGLCPHTHNKNGQCSSGAAPGMSLFYLSSVSMQRLISLPAYILLPSIS